MDLNEGYYAAACVYSRLGFWVEYKLYFIAYLHGAKLVDLDASAFTDSVVADGHIERVMKMYSAPVGSVPMPTNMSEIDISKWTPIHEDPEIHALFPGRRLEALRQAQMALLQGRIVDLTQSKGNRSKLVSGVGKNKAAPTFTTDPRAPYAHPYFWAPFILIGNWQ